MKRPTMRFWAHPFADSLVQVFSTEPTWYDGWRDGAGAGYICATMFAKVFGPLPDDDENGNRVLREYDFRGGRLKITDWEAQP